MPFAVPILALGIFVINTSEFVIMGLLPEFAADFAVSIPTAGYLISGYAFGVVLGAPLLTPFLVRFPRKSVLIVLMGLFTLGNLQAARQSQTREAVNRLFFRMFAGWSLDHLALFAESWFAFGRARSFYVPEVLEPFRQHQVDGHQTVLLSGSATFIIAPIARHLGATHTCG